MERWRLVADVGGTNVRFARAISPAAIHGRRAYRGSEYPSFEDALAQYLSETGAADGCTGAAIGAAGPVEAGAVKLTNSPWRIAAPDISHILAGVPVRIVNDLQAVAFALPVLNDGDITAMGAPEKPDLSRAMLAVNVGTGFGAASVFLENGRWMSRGAEPGHMALAAVSEDERRFFDGFETVEDVLSGRGLVALHNRLAIHHGEEAAPGAASILSAAAGQIGAGAVGETIRLVTGLLGRIAGDLVLATGAWGGVFFCGSVARAWAEVADAGAMRVAFERKGLMTDRMRGVYTGVIRNETADLIGLAALPLD